MKNFPKITLITVVAFMLFNCKGKDGATGPQGIQGTQGNSNVTTTTITTSTWSSSTSSSGAVGQHSYINVPSITQSILDKGSVSVFWQSSASSKWIGLPFSGPIGTNGLEGNVGFAYSLNSLVVIISQSDGADPGNPGSLTIKIVVTAGN
jgi:hypothetical protein